MRTWLIAVLIVAMLIVSAVAVSLKANPITGPNEPVPYEDIRPRIHVSGLSR